ncbi:hypothetical protein [Mycolicibacter kumamotonensis]|uniref:Uncharacterized protein n=1 Tax=Mycolicibacter kumamotonensis TaxID=354243 RepID=A0A1B8SL51_9MYCO|nr:hypothetical protein [Mycolicibacter kumamotonensis]OBY33437.1 hypothetical protein ACT18_00320 [Mycolicibacter kumamotonensis]
MDIFDVIRLRDLNSLRAFLYTLTPVVLLALGVSNSQLWIGAALAVLSPSLAAINSVNGFRTWFYGVLAAVQALLVGLHVFTDAQLSPWIAVITAVVGGAVATSHVRTEG